MMVDKDMQGLHITLNNLLIAVEKLAVKVSLASELAEKTAELSKAQKRENLRANLTVLLIAIVVPLLFMSIFTSAARRKDICEAINVDRKNAIDLWTGVIDRSRPGENASPEEIAAFESGKEARDAFVKDIHRRYAQQNC